MQVIGDDNIDRVDVGPREHFAIPAVYSHIRKIGPGRICSLSAGAGNRCQLGVFNFHNRLRMVYAPQAVSYQSKSHVKSSSPSVKIEVQRLQYDFGFRNAEFGFHDYWKI
jgi:hypothetical protein